MGCDLARAGSGMIRGVAGAPTEGGALDCRAVVGRAVLVLSSSSMSMANTPRSSSSSTAFRFRLTAMGAIAM